MVREKLSSLRAFLSRMLKPNHSNHHKYKFYLISGIRLACKFVILDIKSKKTIVLIFFEILALFLQLPFIAQCRLYHTVWAMKVPSIFCTKGYTT
jgi:hypothetical protein